MIYTVVIENNKEVAYLLNSWNQYFNLTFNPDSIVLCTIELGRLKVKTYQDKKKCIQEKAIEYSNNQYPGLTYSEYNFIDDYFTKYASRFGLLEEFKENCII